MSFQKKFISSKASLQDKLVLIHTVLSILRHFPKIISNEKGKKILT